MYKIREDRVVLIITYGLTVSSFDGLQCSNEHDEAQVFPVHEVHELNLPSGYKTSIATYWETIRGLRSLT